MCSEPSDALHGLLEVRGFYPGLNRIDYGSDDDMSPEEEAAGALIGPDTTGDQRVRAPTDPTRKDTTAHIGQLGVLLLVQFAGE